MKINEIVDEAFVINLDRRPDRLAKAQEQFSKNNISVKRFSAIDGKDIELHPNLPRGAAGCLESQLSIIRLAIDNNLDAVAIFEDDVFFVDDFESRFSIFYSQVPEDWQFIYFANNKYNARVERISENVERVSDAWSAHAFLLRRKAMEVIVEVASDGDYPIDVYYGILQRHLPSYSAVPSLAGQAADFSDIENVYIDYNTIYGL